MSNQLNRPPRKRIDMRVIMGALAALYTASPVDAIPDAIPVLGQADDASVIVFCVLIILFLTLQGGN